MQKLPSVEEQDWLVDALTRLVAVAGPGHFVSMPVVEPTRQFFPDPWIPGIEGLDRVTRRLMQYASLGDLQTQVGLFSANEDPPQSDRHSHRSVAGVFLGIDGGVCHFAFNAANPADEAHSIGVMAHEVAHAFRAVHDLHIDSREEEEFLTDVTAAYLGFGVLATNNSYRFRSSGEVMGSWVRHTWSTNATGYLPPQAFCYLLAVQLTTRSTPPREVNRLLEHLEPNQRDFTRMAIKSCHDRAIQLSDRLGLPAIPDAMPALDAILLPLPKYVAPSTTDPEPEEQTFANSGHPVFRLSRSKAHFYAYWFAVLAFAVGFLVTIQIWDSAVGMVAGAIGLILGAAWGRRKRWEVCSDPGCLTVLEPATTVCPGCGGTIAGSIRRASDRLAAEEAWEDAQGRP